MDAISTLFNAGLVPKLTSYFSVAYLAIFLPAAIVVYWLLPQKARRWFLLAHKRKTYCFSSVGNTFDLSVWSVAGQAEC